MILPVALLVALTLCVQARWRVAAAWVTAVVGVLGTIAVLKVLGYACGWLWPVLAPERLAIRSPSGHAGSATVVYGGLVGLAAARAPWGGRGALIAAAFVAGLGIGATRLSLAAHTPGEVVVGLLIGLAGAVAFALLAGERLAERSGLPALIGAGALMLLLHGRRLPAEMALEGPWTSRTRIMLTACVPAGSEGRP